MPNHTDNQVVLSHKDPKQIDMIYNRPFHHKDVAMIDLVMQQIQTDISNGDLTAVEILLDYIPEYVLRAYLPEEM